MHVYRSITDEKVVRTFHHADVDSQVLFPSRQSIGSGRRWCFQCNSNPRRGLADVGSNDPQTGGDRTRLLHFGGLLEHGARG